MLMWLKGVPWTDSLPWGWWRAGREESDSHEGETQPVPRVPTEALSPCSSQRRWGKLTFSWGHPLTPDVPATWLTPSRFGW